MQIICRFLGQRPRLAVWEHQPLSPGVEAGPRPGDRHDRYERQVAHELPGRPESGGPFERLARAIRAYEVFPPRLVGGVLARAPVQPGDTYGIVYHFLPGVDLFFAGRVTQSFEGLADGLWQAGFTFRTVRGHPELGEETFRVEKDPATGAVRVVIQSWSRPGLWLTRLAPPLARVIQVRVTHAALDNLARMASRGASAPGVSLPRGPAA
jgi:hypothetical protein